MSRPTTLKLFSILTVLASLVALAPTVNASGEELVNASLCDGSDTTIHTFRLDGLGGVTPVTNAGEGLYCLDGSVSTEEGGNDPLSAIRIDCYASWPPLRVGCKIVITFSD